MMPLGEAGILLESFPSDEEILARLRATNAQITIDGTAIPTDHLTTDYFTVRWYVLKYHQSDAWHIDGVLVAKEGRFTVKKTFAGDSEAVKDIKMNFRLRSVMRKIRRK